MQVDEWAAGTTLRYPAGDVLVVSGLPGSGKSTLMRRAVDEREATGTGGSGAVRRIDSQDVRLHWEALMPALLPYAAYRPLVRLDHYARLRRALRTGASLVVHDCGSLAWVRRWLARDARRRGRGLHLLVLDVPEDAARAGQLARGRMVSGYAMARHRRAARRLVALAGPGGRPDGCVSALLLDRSAAGAVRRIVFGGALAVPWASPAAVTADQGSRQPGNR
ncbi:AAA family ATPase [Streptomyces sp. H39-S7]|uniref:AAA family ATPase n=1 Tax=Streptomyces sp. H39-S7 TaxID=3004357 RepID=UPI0022AEB557|nr:AAA family ATPase [Streptomyces sp. H39-S7]MCZ4121485.1 ATP-binding protein [Streptomyces sp. H39-S7]